MQQIPGVVDLSTEQQNNIRCGVWSSTAMRWLARPADRRRRWRASDGLPWRGHHPGARSRNALIWSCGPVIRPPSRHPDAGHVGDVLVDTPGGAKVTLKSLARITRSSGPT